MTREKFEEKIREYLYENCKEFSSVDEINDVLDRRPHWFNRYYRDLTEKSMSIDDIANEFSLIFRILTKDEFKQEVALQLSKNYECNNVSSAMELINKDEEFLNQRFKEGLENKDFFHAVHKAESDYYYRYLY